MANRSKSKKSPAPKRGMPGQTQRRQPGREHKMQPRPQVIDEERRSCGRLEGKAAIITGGDSGIGRAVAVAFAREGADIAIVYLEETRDAEETRDMVENEGKMCLLIKGDIGRENFCMRAIEQAAHTLGHIDVLINNAAEQHARESIEDIDEKQLERTFRTNIFSMFFMTKAALPHLKRRRGSSIVNTTSVTAYRGSPELLDYSATKGAIVTFTRSLSGQLVAAGPGRSPIRVNAVAPGPIWTPLIPATFPKDKVREFGTDVPMGRPGQPQEVGQAFVYLASDDASYVTGQVIHVNGGELING
jgi:NAD(P)-dependent dehydrogenase (short-subunit alcohol dehydrogenase family)